MMQGCHTFVPEVRKKEMYLSPHHPGLQAMAWIFTVWSGLAAEPPLEDDDLPRRPPLSAAQAMAAFKVAPGMRIELAACEPAIVDPVALDFDETGALYVVEMRDYSERRGEKLSRIKRLRDLDGDGLFEDSTVFLDGLAWATGVTCWGGGILVASTPDIIFARDVTGDGVADERRVVLTGFGAGRDDLNVQALVNSLTFGPDNRIWGATAGNGGQVAGVSLDGADFSFDPVSSELTAETGTAQFGLSFDAAGRRFVCSNSHHLQWVALERPYANHPLVRGGQSLVDIAVDGPAAPVFRLSPEEPWRVVRTRWRASGVLPGIIEGGGRASGYFTSASGLCVYTGDLMPTLSGHVLVGDVGSNLVHRKHLTETAEGPQAERPPGEETTEFLASTDSWFRPVACANGPDGALYVIDMYREVIEHPQSLPAPLKSRLDLNSGHDRGRLYRILPEHASPRRQTDLGSLETTALAALTRHPNGWHRTTARRLLTARRDPAAAAPLRAAGGFDALAALDGLGLVTTDDLRQALQSDTEAVVRLALRLLETRPTDAPSLAADLSKLANHPAASVRRQWALSLGRLPLKNQTLERAALWNQPSAPSRLREAVRLSLLSGRDTFELLQSLNEPDPEMVAMIGRSEEAAVIAETAEWLHSRLHDSPGRLFAMITALNDRDTLSRLTEAAIACVLDMAASASDRTSAAAVLVRAGGGAATGALEQVFFDPAVPDPVRTEAWPAVTGARASDVWAAWPGLSAWMRGRVLERAAATSDWHQPLLTAVADGRIGALELTAAQAQHLRASTDPVVQSLALTALGPPPADRQAAIAARLPLLKLNGDAAVGENVFRQRCLTCHRLGQDGAEVGPDRITFRHIGKPALLASVLDPNREVAPRFLAATVTTTTGESWQGLLQRDDPTGVTLRLAGGREIELSRTNITRFERLTRSLMPEGLETGLSEAELAGLLEFLIQ